MRKNYFLILLFLAFAINTLAQTNVSISEHYQGYFKPSEEESIFIHLNKTTYLIGEEIWFKGYIFNKRNEEISLISTNLYIGLYDKDGKEISKKLVRIRKGFTHGNLELEKELSSGTYYIKATTQQMVDKQSTQVFIEEITIYGKSTSSQEQNNLETDKYDIQFLPEGGHIVKDIENTIAFKAINQEGKGVYVHGIVYDGNGNKITSFESNNYGIGTFQLLPKSNNAYKAKTTFKEEEISEKLLPKVENTGIAIQVNNTEKDSIKISLNTNTETLHRIISKDYTLLIHKDGWVRSMPFSFKNNEKAALTIARSGLFNGVNAITLFDGKTPILERMFFNRKVVKNLSVMIKKTETENDYSKFSLYLIKNKPRIRDANVSISILPETTEAYNPAHNIFSSFYLKPYVRGEIENPKYYFPNTTKTKRKALDALLITQGWSKYDWATIFQNSKKKPIIEQGVTIRGTVNFPTKHVTGMFLHDTKELPAQYIPIDKEQNFVVYNLFPEAGEKLRFSYINHKKEFLKPKLYLRYNVSKEKDEIPANANIDRSFLNKNNIFRLPYNFFPSDAEALDAVLLSGSNTNEKKKNRDPMMVNGKETKIGVDEYLRYGKVTTFIQNNGYEVIKTPLSLGKINIVRKRRLRLNLAEVSPLVFLDNVPLTDFNILADFSIANVERIIVDKSGLGYGMRGTGGVIKIFSRKTPLTKIAITRKDSYVDETPPIGFSIAKEYYKPKYRSFSSKTYQKYGAIDWRPNNHIPRRGSFDFIVKHKDVKAITMYIEGVSKDGSLISEKRTITIKEDDK